MHPTRIFKHPDELEKAWNEFKADLEEQSKQWIKIQYVGKDGEQKRDPMKVPMTMEGFERFCYKKYGMVEQYFKNKDALYNDFVPICSHIRKEIRENQIIGGLLGVYNPSITQRLNGLKEATDITTGGEKLTNEIDYSKLSSDVLKAIVEAENKSNK